MYKGTNEITNKGLGFKLTNSTSFGEFVIFAGFIRCGKVPKDLRGLHTEAGGEALPCGPSRPHLLAARPLGPPVSLLVAMSVSHCLLGCISTVP
jgi:hypothetical protein